MKSSQISRELRRIAHREVPNGQPNLWPGIQRQLSQTRPGVSSSAGLTGRSNLDGDLSSVYVWSADERRDRFGAARVLAAGVAVLALVIVLAVVLSNRGGGNDQQLGAGSAATQAGSPTPSTPATPAAPPTWSSSGKVVVPIEPMGDSSAGGTVTAQILPSGAVRISSGVQSDSGRQYNWHVVPQSCAAVAGQTEDQIATNDIIPSFLQMGLYPAFVPAAKSHQPLTLVGYTRQGDPPMACASIPAVPDGFVATYQPASIVPNTCPVTLPTSPPFFTPSLSPRLSQATVLYGDYWYGTDDLWTGLPLDGVWNSLNQKVFWWSVNYSVNAEPIPALAVTGTRLDGQSTQAQVDTPTNANGQMLVGVDFPTGGCWKVTGQYQNHTDRLRGLGNGWLGQSIQSGTRPDARHHADSRSGRADPHRSRMPRHLLRAVDSRRPRTSTSSSAAWLRPASSGRSSISRCRSTLGRPRNSSGRSRAVTRSR